MAKRHFMSKCPSGRNQSAHSKDKKVRASPTSKKEGTFDSSLEEAIEQERERLQQADSILGCLHSSLELADEDASDPPYYPDLVALARKLVREAVNRLDSIYLGKL